MSSQSFSEIERQAQVAEGLREQQVADAKKQAEESMCVSAREARAYMGLGGQAGRVRLCAELWHVCSLEGLPPCVLAYQELQIDRKKEEKLQNLEGKKREQAERLGMGLVSRR